MNVILLANYQADAQESMLRFGRVLDQSLAEQGHDVKTWHPPRVFGWLRIFPKRAEKWLRYVDKFVLGPLQLVMLRVVHRSAHWHIVDHGNAMYAAFLPADRLSITCHDCIAIEEARRPRTGEVVGAGAARLQAWIALGLRRARMVVAVSQATADDLMRLDIVPKDRLAVVHNALVVPFAPLEKAEAKRVLGQCNVPTDLPFLFMVGSNLKRKNRIGAIKIFEQLQRSSHVPRRLIMAGKSWSDEVRRAVAASPLAEFIYEAGRLSDEALQACYSLAEATLFPSLDEGFGLPIIEGQSCGGVVVASDIPPMPEVGGDGAYYANPRDAAAFAQTITMAMGDVALPQRAAKNAKRFRPQAMAEAYLRVFVSCKAGSAT